MLTKPNLASILASFHKTIVKLERLEGNNSEEAIRKELDIADLQSDVEELHRDGDTAHNVAAKLRELIV